ncbi:RNase HII [Nakamurella panacisegetis]|uniref:Ribonuclease n=1 Tax=Nakamurella panacisegetis TaxID=1090615 RepID=A0A1H0R7P1_9ACTN|nr:ribonuclease HII [Nakamurella panacisegetis]SDP25066.1 RNase HII [Nakamurella panacisegetis]
MSVGSTRPHLRLEKELLRGGVTRLAAMDEVGRGALAGPVTVGVVVVTARIGRVPAGLKDSKLLTPLARESLLPAVRRWAGEYAVGHASPAEIDRIGIIAALRLAGRRALAQLPGPVDAVLLDGNHDYLSEPEPVLFDDEIPPLPLEPDLPTVTGPVYTRIKADLTCAGVAGASVLAKTERDGLLRRLAADYPAYLFDVNKGYGTAEHVAALREHGPSEVHRRSWRLPVAGDLVDEFESSR